MATNAAPEPDRGSSLVELHPRKISEELAELKVRSEEKALTLHEVIEVLGTRAYAILVLLLALPFATPIPLPGLSTVFGLVIAHVALSFTLGREPWIPKRFQTRTIPQGFFGRMIRVAAWIILLLERRLRPRLGVLVEGVFVRRVHAGLLVVAAVALLLPLPIPFTNSFPAWAIILVAAGLLERDGVSILAGYGVFAVGALYFFFLGEAAQRLLVLAKDWLLSWW